MYGVCLFRLKTKGERMFITHTNSKTEDEDFCHNCWSLLTLLKTLCLDYKYHRHTHSMNLITHCCEIIIFWWAQITFLKERYFFSLTTKIIILDIRRINGTRKFIPCFLMFQRQSLLLCWVCEGHIQRHLSTGTHKWKLWKYAPIKCMHFLNW